MVIYQIELNPNLPIFLEKIPLNECHFAPGFPDLLSSAPGLSKIIRPRSRKFCFCKLAGMGDSCRRDLKSVHVESMQGQHYHIIALAAALHESIIVVCMIGIASKG